ncbi:5-formyltetrahydrofolate cyclo-ligase [Pontibaca salina]|uniref:5-formyltetrahydrofolate cyclo-ligase n=1 Tax=Pontibaca salina TaxID=2795731 RepID=A0A934HNK1_9RHOB|nr:5-formyltetrahydrofolate cyclo-ligase [Pontibaca salina]MBI6628877.1 5-formyltetrahydrofolate cyclo-ligase [Pontibaca salina]
MSDSTGGSEPCFAHELIDGHPVDPQTAKDVARFRTRERARLYEMRRSTSQSDNAQMAQVVGAELDRLINAPQGQNIAVYWPIRGEMDLRPWMTKAHEAGANIALPVVLKKGQPLEFRPWAPRCKMERGIWNIPVPVDGDAVQPDIVISAVLGIDNQLYRLGNGGGYYDRTLAAMDKLPWVIGVGQPFARMKSIFPLPWDIPMQTVVLGDGSVQGHIPN